MRLFIISVFILLLAGIANADYTMKSVYRFDNVDMIKNMDDSTILNLTVNGFQEDSNGNKATSKCLISLRNSVLNGNCQGTDQDGDIEYSTVERDLSKGNVGTILRKGGTGKYVNKTSVCEYTVQITNFKIGVGFLTASCKE